AVALLALALVLAHAQGSDVLGRFAAVGLVAGLAAGIGLLPYLHPFDPEDPVSASPIAWFAFIGPVLAVVVVAGTHGVLGPDAGGAFGATLVGVGLVNVAWGGVAVWSTENTIAAWRLVWPSCLRSTSRSACIRFLCSRPPGNDPDPLGRRDPRGGASPLPGPGRDSRVRRPGRARVDATERAGARVARAFTAPAHSCSRHHRRGRHPRVGPACCALQPGPRGGAQHRAGRRGTRLHSVGRACANGRVRGRAWPAAG